MCETCWSNDGAPQIDTADVREAAVLISRIYDAPGGSVGGNLHIVISDQNVDDASVTFCRRRVAAGGEGDQAHPDLLALERSCLDLFERMTPAERHSAIALEEGWWKL